MYKPYDVAFYTKFACKSHVYQTENTASTIIFRSKRCFFHCFIVAKAFFLKKYRRIRSFSTLTNCRNPQTVPCQFMQFFESAKKRRRILSVFTNKNGSISKKLPLLFYFITFSTHLKSKIFLLNPKNLNRFYEKFPMTAKYCVPLSKTVVQTATNRLIFFVKNFLPP